MARDYNDSGISDLVAAELSGEAYKTVIDDGKGNVTGGTCDTPSDASGWEVSYKYSGERSFTLSSGLSGKDQFITYINTTTSQAMFVFKGTDNAADAQTDAINDGYDSWSVIGGTASAKLAAMREDPLYANYTCYSDGHSLGGGLAQTFALKEGLSGFTQNSLPIARTSLLKTAATPYITTVENGQTTEIDTATWFDDWANGRYGANGGDGGNFISSVVTEHDPATYAYGLKDELTKSTYLPSSQTVITTSYDYDIDTGVALQKKGYGITGDILAIYGIRKDHDIGAIVDSLKTHYPKRMNKSDNSSLPYYANSSAANLTFTALDTGQSMSQYASILGTVDSSGSGLSADQISALSSFKLTDGTKGTDDVDMNGKGYHVTERPDADSYHDTTILNDYGLMTVVRTILSESTDTIALTNPYFENQLQLSDLIIVDDIGGNKFSYDASAPYAGHQPITGEYETVAIIGDGEYLNLTGDSPNVKVIGDNDQISTLTDANGGILDVQGTGESIVGHLQTFIADADSTATITGTAYDVSVHDGSTVSLDASAWKSPRYDLTLQEYAQMWKSSQLNITLGDAEAYEGVSVRKDDGSGSAVFDGSSLGIYGKALQVGVDGADTYVAWYTLDGSPINVRVDGSGLWTVSQNGAVVASETRDGTGYMVAANHLDGKTAFVWGEDEADSVAGTAGDDILSTKGGDDTLMGGQGNDLLKGGMGGDRYLLAAGDGADEVSDVNSDAGADRVAFDASVLRSSLKFTQNATGDITVGYGNGDSVKPDGWNADAANGTTNDAIVLADGSVVTRAQAADFALAAALLTGTAYADWRGDAMQGTSGADNLNGGTGNDVITGGRGDDVMSGGRGVDTFQLAVGDGHDVINAYDTTVSHAVIQFAQGITASSVTRSVSYGDVILSYGNGDSVRLLGWGSGSDAGASVVDFADGTTLSESGVITAPSNPIAGTTGNDNLSGTTGSDQLYGYAGNDQLSGGAGNDLLIGGTGADNLVGGAGADTYTFSTGDDADIVDDSNTDAATNIIRFDETAGVTTANVRVTEAANATDLVLGYGTNDSITLKGWLASAAPNGTVNSEVTFSDGKTLTQTQILDLALARHGSTLYGDYRANTLQGVQGGANQLYGYGGNDTLVGLAGNHSHLIGGAGDDTYEVGMAAGESDQVQEVAGNHNTFVFGSGVTAASLTGTVSQGTGDVSFVSGTGASTATLSIEAAFNQRAAGPVSNDSFVFSDGTTLGWEDVFARTFSTTPGSQIVGDGGANEIHAVASNTVLAGYGADTVYAGTGGGSTFYGGMGSDDGSTDRFVFGPGMKKNTVGDFTATGVNHDVLDLATALFADAPSVLAAASQSGSNTVITYDANNAITLTGVNKNTLTASDFAFH